MDIKFDKWYPVDRDKDIAEYVGIVIEDPDQDTKKRFSKLIKRNMITFTDSDKGQLIGKVRDNKIVVNVRTSDIDRLTEVIENIGTYNYYWNMIIPESRMKGDLEDNYSVIVGGYTDGRKVTPLWIPRTALYVDDKVITAVFAGRRYMVALCWLDGYNLFRVTIEDGEINKERIDPDKLEGPIRDNIYNMLITGWYKLFDPLKGYYVPRLV